GSDQLGEILRLPDSPLANRLLTREQLALPEPRYPLSVVFCPRCSLVQLRHTVSPEVLFKDYVYFSSNSAAAVAHARAHAQALVASRRLDGRSLVVEAASNDGYLLSGFVEAGVPVLGIEPAANVAAAATAAGVPTRVEFFGEDCARGLAAEGLAADVFLGNNVLAHVDDLNGFVAGAARLIKEDGLVELEFPYVGDLIDRLEFDTIYHEHLCYFSAHAVEALFARHELVFTDVARLPIHGGSLRVSAARRAEPAGRRRVESLLQDERERGLVRAPYYLDFGAAVTALSSRLRALLGGLKSAGRRLAAYGASAKGTTLLNTTRIDGALLDYVVDRSPVKQGRFTPGTHLAIHAPERLLSDRPDAVLLLTWNFADEILEQQAAYRSSGGRFIVPVPEPRLV
ncbi:MAG TPA: class I SAM-dependent methyltransferase, partial [Planctomycetota bacterium]|nr:class I SAM-dependent methyltransferase [Planctomycetota bacterium]